MQLPNSLLKSILKDISHCLYTNAHVNLHWTHFLYFAVYNSVYAIYTQLLWKASTSYWISRWERRMGVPLSCKCHFRRSKYTSRSVQGLKRCCCTKVISSSLQITETNPPILVMQVHKPGDKNNLLVWLAVRLYLLTEWCFLCKLGYFKIFPCPVQPGCGE